MKVEELNEAYSRLVVAVVKTDVLDLLDEPERDLGILQRRKEERLELWERYSKLVPTKVFKEVFGKENFSLKMAFVPLLVAELELPGSPDAGKWFLRFLTSLQSHLLSEFDPRSVTGTVPTPDLWTSFTDPRWDMIHDALHASN